MYHVPRGGVVLKVGSRNGEVRNEKLEMRKWKRKWKWSSLLLVDNTDVPIESIYGVSKYRIARNIGGH